MTEIQHIELRSGRSKVLAVKLRDGVVAMDLATVLSAQYRIAQAIGATTLVDKSFGAGITVANAATGLLDIALAPSDTAGKSGDFLHELTITEIDGSVSTAFSGTVKIVGSLI